MPYSIFIRYNEYTIETAKKALQMFFVNKESTYLVLRYHSKTNVELNTYYLYVQKKAYNLCKVKLEVKMPKKLSYCNEYYFASSKELSEKYMTYKDVVMNLEKHYYQLNGIIK